MRRGVVRARDGDGEPGADDQESEYAGDGREPAAPTRGVDRVRDDLLRAAVHAEGAHDAMGDVVVVGRHEADHGRGEDDEREQRARNPSSVIEFARARPLIAV